jgi:hypothetical protein
VEDINMGNPIPNIALEFISTRDWIPNLGLWGYLDDEGLLLKVHHEYNSVLELANTIAGEIKKYKTALDVLLNPTNIGKNADMTQGYLQGGILLNSPYLWTSTSPLSFSLTLFQIAQGEKEIINTYQKVLRMVSPNMASGGDNIKGDALNYGNEIGISLNAQGPCPINVHYFPKFTDIPVGSTTVTVPQGRIKFMGCMCTDASMKIKAPFDKYSSPIVGEYTFQLQTARIVDQNSIDKIFEISNAGG